MGDSCMYVWEKPVSAWDSSQFFSSPSFYSVMESKPRVSRTLCTRPLYWASPPHLFLHCTLGIFVFSFGLSCSKSIASHQPLQLLLTVLCLCFKQPGCDAHGINLFYAGCLAELSSSQPLALAKSTAGGASIWILSWSHSCQCTLFESYLPFLS